MPSLSCKRAAVADEGYTKTNHFVEILDVGFQKMDLAQTRKLKKVVRTKYKNGYVLSTKKYDPQFQCKNVHPPLSEVIDAPLLLSNIVYPSQDSVAFFSFTLIDRLASQ